ncbi:hypothetical protein ACIQUQ_12905 [Streptomyces sp. NPDC101118]|uniref:hypothetical protein n=1 Tax=Streptomyces sp. NPDC101118 TaxID=3366109 RepID=UPI003828EF94
MRPGFRFKIKADDESSFSVMFEPSGMLYELGPSEVMFARLDDLQSEELEIVYWEGGISITPPGAVTTFDATGQELHRLY